MNNARSYYLAPFSNKYKCMANVGLSFREVNYPAPQSYDDSLSPSFVSKILTFLQGTSCLYWYQASKAMLMV